MEENRTDSQIAKMLATQATLINEVSAMKDEIKKLHAEVLTIKEMSDAWRAVKTTGQFFKWLAGVGTGLAGVWLFMKAVGHEVLK